MPPQQRKCALQFQVSEVHVRLVLARKSNGKRALTEPLRIGDDWNKKNRWRHPPPYVARGRRGRGGAGSAALFRAGSALSQSPDPRDRAVRGRRPERHHRPHRGRCALSAARSDLVIDNRAGGGANIGIGLAARAEPDGYTLLITTSAFVINPSLYKKIPFDPIKDFSPISDLAISPQMLSVMPGYVNTLAEFIAKAKAAPGKLNYSSPGVGTQAQLTVELLKLRAGIDIVHVPFSGGPPAVQALLSGSVQLTTNAVPTSAEAGGGRHHSRARRQRQSALFRASRRADPGRERLSRLRHRYLCGLFRAGRHAAGSHRPARERDAGGARRVPT